MGAGQAVLPGALDVAAVLAVEERLAARRIARGAAHVADLRDALALHALHVKAGLGLCTVAVLAPLLRCSELRAGQLLADAQLLVELPGAFEALESGLLTVEGSQELCAQLAALPDPVALAVWERLHAELERDEQQGVVRPPARLRELLRRLVIAADPAGAQTRRQQAQDGGKVDYQRRPDSLVDIYALGLSAPNAHACLSAIAVAAAPVGPDDPRTADQRRRDAFVDLILNRQQLPFTRDTDDREHPDDPGEVDGHEGSGSRAGRCGRSRCGCGTGAPVPCGADVQVLVPLGAALGTTDELAELIGHGPLEPDLLQALLHAAARLRPVWVDEHGTPVAAGTTALRPGRGDPVAVRAALLELAASPPPAERVPRHPDDHPPDTPPRDRAEYPPRDDPPPGPASGDPPPDEPAPGDPAPDDLASNAAARSDAAASHAAAVGAGRPRLLTWPHPVALPGPYRVPGRLRRLLRVRAQRCEWPGCEARAAHCDLDHDLPWPAGPTCGCNVGPLCRRHHRIKQHGWTKQRTGTAVRWTSPTGRTWTSPSQHQPPQPATRPLPPVTAPTGCDILSPGEQEQALWDLDPSNPLFDDPAAHELRAQDLEPPDDTDSLGQRLADGLTRWTLDLADPYAWLDLPSHG